MTRLLFPVLLFLPQLAAANPIAEVICAPSSQMVDRLTSVGHKRQASGIRDPEQMMEVWTDHRGDWTMVVRYASGTSCIVAMGEAWDAVQAKDPA